MMVVMKQLEFTNPSHNGAEPADVWKARRFIEQNSSEAMSLTSVAQVANISPTHLSEKFKKVAGINFVDYVARIRVGKARDLLQNSNLRISEIAFAVGFQSLSQFNRVFKKLTRKSPTQFRTAHNKRAKSHQVQRLHGKTAPKYFP